MTTPDHPHSTWHTVWPGISLLSGRERKIAIAFAIAIALVEMMQLVGMLLVVPVISLLVDESSFTTSPHIVQLAAWIGNPPFETFLCFLAGTALVLLVTAHLATFAVQSATEIFTARVQTRLLQDVLSECVAAPYPWFLDRNAAALVRLFQNDFPVWGREFIGNILVVFSNVVAIAGGTILIVAVAPFRGLIAMIGAALIAWFSVTFVRQRIVYWTREKRREAERSSIALTELLAGIKDVITSGGWRHFTRLCAMRFGSMSRASARAVIFGAFPVAALTLLAQAGLLLILLALWYGGARGGALAAQMALVMLVVSRIVPALGRMAGVATRIVNSAPWVAGIVELRSSVQEAQRQSVSTGKANVPSWSHLRFRDVTFVYPRASKPALDGVSLEWRANRCYGLIGASGGGKTTFVDLLLGLLEPTRGQIMVDEMRLSAVDIAKWRRRIGYVSQSPYLVDGSVRENIVFGDVCDEDRLAECVEMAGLKDFVLALPRGLDTGLGDRAVTISGGQRQRIAIARALYRNPDILVLDEATSALDAATERHIVETLARLKSRMMILVVSHRETTLEICDEIFALKNGRLEPSRASGARMVSGVAV